MTSAMGNAGLYHSLTAGNLRSASQHPLYTTLDSSLNGCGYPVNSMEEALRPTQGYISRSAWLEVPAEAGLCFHSAARLATLAVATSQENL